MHIVFLLGNYYPTYSAVGKCLGNLADELAKEHQITVICQLSKTDEKTADQYQTQKIIRITTSYQLRRLKLEEKMKKNDGKISHFLKLRYFGLRAENTLRMLLCPQSLNKSFINAYVRGLERIDEPIDLIVPTCNPFDTVVAAMKYKESHPEVVFRPVLFDKFADSETLHRNKINKQLKWKNNQNLERKMFQFSDKVLYMPTWSEYVKKYFASYLNKSLEVEHPLIIRPNELEEEPNNLNNDTIEILYCGSLIVNYIETDFILKIADALKDLDRFHFDFYAKGNGCNIIIQKNLPNVNLHGWVEKKQLDSLITNCNICLNIAEKNGKQISSKIFEYMSFGKPIIHIYYNQNDVNLKYLRQYPLAFCLDANSNIEKSLRTLRQWCEENKHAGIPFEKISESFKEFTPAYISQKLISGFPESQ